MGGRTRCRRRPRAAGFTVLELLVALAVSVVALALASGLLLESQSRMAHAARQALDPVGEIAGQQLRADLRSADGVYGGSSSSWSRDPLILGGHPQGDLRFEKQDDVLYRRTANGRRPLLRSVTTFRWRHRDGSIEIDLRWRVTRRWGPLAAGGVRELPIPAAEKLLFRVTPRGGGSRQW
ncbi:MAG: prepilin-type N-terminal cleavage/methylation domain-containing protein [Thermoanaerobaculia bacterium]